jgi:hypothetical protein
VAAVVVGLGCIWAGMCSAPASQAADAVVHLPDGGQHLETANGINVDFTRTGETAVISPSLAAIPTSRTAWLSGTVFAKVPGATGGTLEVGYLVGCQSDISGGLTLGGDMYVEPGNIYPEFEDSVQIKPGAVTDMKLGTKTIDKTAGAVGYQYSSRGLQIDGCVGAAEARSYSILTVTNDQGSAAITIYGRPFSL